MSAVAMTWEEWHRAVTKDLLHRVDDMSAAVPDTLHPAAQHLIGEYLAEARHAAARRDAEAVAHLFDRVVATLVAEFRGTP
jgi:hypothetical protein